MFDYKSALFELKEVSKTGEITGLASVYDNVDQGGDVVKGGAFASTIAAVNAGAHQIKMLWQHDPRQPIGVWNSVEDGAEGLTVRGRILPEVRAGAEALALLRANAISGLSIGYKTLDAERVTGKAGSFREIREAALWEVSLVTFPMNEAAVVTDVKNLRSQNDVERLLHDAGVPSRFAKLVAKHGFEGATKCLNDGRLDGDAERARVQEAEQYAALLTKLKGLKEIFNA